MVQWLKVYNNGRTFDECEHCVKYKKMAGQSETVLSHTISTKSDRKCFKCT